MKILEIQKHSIVMMIGPSNSGKSFLCNNKIQPALANHQVNARYVSSDDCRREMLGLDLHKHDPRMMAASQHAFSLLEHKVDLFSKFPVNADVILVDATFLSKHGRHKIAEIARKNAYRLDAIVFDYADKGDYVKYIDEKTDRRIIFNMVKEMKAMMKDFDYDTFDKVTSINSIDFDQIAITYSEANVGHLVNHKNVCFVGDIHGCFEEFVELLNDKKGIVVDPEKMSIELIPGSVENGSYIHHILIGDLVDKGPVEGQKKVIELVYRNLDFFTIVEGNHDRWANNYLKKIIKPSEENDKLIDSFFDSVKFLAADDELRNMFFKVYEKSHTFVYNDKFIATHAPCENKFLGKGDKKSLKAMNTIRYPKRAEFENEEAYMDAREGFFKFLIDDASTNQPFHIFGHVMLPNVFMYKNKIGIDTGCVAGNMLSSVILTEKNKNPFVRKYQSKQPVKEERLVPFFRVKQQGVTLESLDFDLQKRIKWMATNRINFVSGTMSPSDKGVFELESLGPAIDYFARNNVKQLILQPKYMGSRCQVYLHKYDLSKSYAVSRNGFKIKDTKVHSDGKTLEDLFKELQHKYEYLFQHFDAEMIIFDGELLPWTVLGKDLIQKDFIPPYVGVTTEGDWLKRTGFDSLLANLNDKYNVVEGNGLSKHEQAQHKLYNSFEPDFWRNDYYVEHVEKYKKQLDLFGKEGEMTYQPFSILKAIAADGSEKNLISSDYSNHYIFTALLRNDTFAYVDLENSVVSLTMEGEVVEMELQEGLNKFWDYITKQNQMEGIVVKPDAVYTPGVAPYMKVRNPEYLRIVYGFDYDALPAKYEKLRARKSIKKKLATSINEWELGREMLNIPHDEISVKNERWLYLATRLIQEMENESGLDPRL